MYSYAILTPMNIHTMMIRNRVVLPAMVSDMGGTGGHVTEQLLSYYEERAIGGVGLIIIEATSVATSGKTFPHGLDLSDDRFIPGLRRLTERVHQHGAHLAIQLQHGGRAANPALSGMPRRLVSLVPGVTDPNDSIVLEKTELDELAISWARAAVRAKQAGFDAVEIHGASGYLLHQFLSLYTNQRTDNYGGSLENRLRFPVQVVRAVREAVGDDYPVLYRHASLEEVPTGNGIDLPTTLEVCRVLADAGVNAFDITAGMQECRQMLGPPTCMPKAWNAATSAAVRNMLDGKARVILTGRISDVDTAERVIQDGAADFVIMGRAHIADSHLVRKFAEGRKDEILTCIACNEGCVGNALKMKPITCALNPLSGREAYMREIPRAAQSKKVLVVGGGPAGMETALVAAQRGHEVTLMEHASELGGQLTVAACPPHKDDLRTIVSFFSGALHRNGVRVKLGMDVTPEAVRAVNPDVVVVATGSVPILPLFCSEAPNIAIAQDILTGKTVAGKSVLVLGGGLIGCETAEFLAEQGAVVTVLEMRSEVAVDMETRARMMLLRRLAAFGVIFLTETEVLSITCSGAVRVRNARKQERTLEGFESLVVAVGCRPDTELYTTLCEATEYSCVRVGDCNKIGKIMDAVHSGFQAAITL